MGNHPLSIEAIFPTVTKGEACPRWSLSNHPLSIEAIFPTIRRWSDRTCRASVTILCQSRLFSPRKYTQKITALLFGNHPLSIEAIFPTVATLG